jgi:hypothetical protein
VAVLVINVLRSAGLAVADPRLAVERAIWTVVKDSPRAQGAVIAIAALLGGPSLGIGVDFQMSFLYTAIGDLRPADGEAAPIEGAITTGGPKRDEWPVARIGR